MVLSRGRRQHPVASFRRQTSLARRAMFGGFANSLIPFPPHKFNGWGSHFTSESGRRRNHARFISQLGNGAYGPRFGRQTHPRGYGVPRHPTFRLRNFGSYSGRYAGGFPRRPMRPTRSSYYMRSSAYRNPYMGSGCGVQPRPSYSRPSWNAPFIRPPVMRRGYPPASRRRETYPAQWYNDTEFSDEEVDDYDDPYEDSEYDDTHYGSGYGQYRSYVTDYDESDEDDAFDDDGYDEEEDYDYDQYDRHGSHPTSSHHQHRHGRDDWY